MKKFIVIANVANNEYAVSVMAQGLCSAEHEVLDLGICGPHAYGVNGAQAYDSESMKTEYFVNALLRAETVSFDELADIIEKRNAEIKAKDEAEDLIRKNTKMIEELKKQIAEAEAVLRA